MYAHQNHVSSELHSPAVLTSEECTKVSIHLTRQVSTLKRLEPSQSNCPLLKVLLLNIVASGATPFLHDLLEATLYPIDNSTPFLGRPGEPPQTCFQVRISGPPPPPSSPFSRATEQDYLTVVLCRVSRKRAASGSQGLQNVMPH